MILFILHLLLFTPRLHQHRDWLYLRGSRGLLLVLFYTLFAKQTNNFGRVTLDKKFSPSFTLQMQSLWDAVAVPYLTCWFTWTEKYVLACNIWNVDKCWWYLQVSDTLWLPPVLPKHL